MKKIKTILVVFRSREEADEIIVEDLQLIEKCKNEFGTDLKFVLLKTIMKVSSHFLRQFDGIVFFSSNDSISMLQKEVLDIATYQKIPIMLFNKPIVDCSGSLCVEQNESKITICAKTSTKQDDSTIETMMRIITLKSMLKY